MTGPSRIISEYLLSEIERGTFPSAQYIVGESRRIVWEDAVGWASVEPERAKASLDTIYDLASLTKPLVTALLSVMLAERGLLSLDASVANYLGEFEGVPIPVTLINLLTHTSGLPPWRPLYLEANEPKDACQSISRAMAESSAPAGQRAPVVYSDLNYVLLGCVIERVTGSSLSDAARNLIFEPLGLKRTMFNPPQELKSECAATERGQGYELAAIVGVAEKHDGKGGSAGSLSLRHASNHDDDPVSMTADFPLAPSEQQTGIVMSRHPLRRTDVIRGEAHDGNAYFMGGAAGHAGLFSTAREVFRLANQFLPASELVTPGSLHLFTDNLTRGRGDERSVGWVLASTPNCSAGPRLPLTAFGHTGFTGTSLWIDPEKQRVFVLLTNRVHPKVGTIEMREPRQRFNSLAVEAFDPQVEK